jgi:hypothetical protein
LFRAGFIAALERDEILRLHRVSRMVVSPRRSAITAFSSSVMDATRCAVCQLAEKHFSHRLTQMDTDKEPEPFDRFSESVKICV